jgi:hypothetical protein
MYKNKYLDSLTIEETVMSLLREKILTRKFQVRLLVTVCILFCIIQLTVFKQTSAMVTAILCLMLLCSLAIAGILFWILNAKRLRNDNVPWISYMATYRISSALYLLFLSFQPVTEKHDAIDTGHVYATSVTHHCQWCGKEYHHTGYFHVANECVHPQEDIGTDECCSEKCCMEKWNSKF